MKRMAMIFAATGGLALSLLAAGCDKLAVTARGYVKAQAQIYSRHICDKDFSAAADFHHPDFVWRPFNGGKLVGKEATDAFLKSLKDISKMDTFYFYVHEEKQIDENTIALIVTMQAHTVEDSMQMVYDNTIWKAKMGWVKTDIAEWKLANITEDSVREAGQTPPKDIKPL